MRAHVKGVRAFLFLKQMKSFSFLICFIIFSKYCYAESFTSEDSLKAANDSSLVYKYPARAPFSLNFGLGVAIFTGDATVPEPVYGKYYVNTGYTFDLSGSIPLPGLKIFGVNFHYFSMNSSDEIFCSTPFREEDWLSYDPNGQYGLQGFLNGGAATYWTTSFVSAYPMYQLHNAYTIGPALWIPLSKNRRINFYLSPAIGKGKMVHGQFEHYLEETFFVSTGNPMYRATKLEESQKVSIREFSTGFLFSPGKHFNIKFNFGYITSEKKEWNYETRFYVQEQLKDVYFHKQFFGLEYYQISFSAGVRF